MDSVQKEKLQIAYKKAKANLVNYRHILLSTGEDEVSPPPFHYEWSDILLKGTDNTAIEGFRESAKTQIVLRAFPLYALTFPSKKRDYIVIIKNNATLARNKLKEIEAEYTSNPAISANCLSIKQESSDVLSVDCKDEHGETINVRIEAYGKGASIRGLSNVDRRPRIVIIDDPQDIEDASSDTVVDTDWTWFLSDVKFLGQNTRIFLIGNNLGERCIIERIFANPEELGFQTHRVAVMKDDEPTWPSKYKAEDIIAEKDKYRKLGKLDIWLREKMCLATSDETRLFKKEDFRYYGFKTAERIRADSNVFITVDPAVSTKDNSDYRAIVVTAVDESNSWFVLDISYGRYDPMEFLDELFRLVVYWQVKEVGIEQGVLKSALEPFMMKEMSRRNQFFTILPLKADKKKEERIRWSLQPRFKAHTIYFPDEAQWLTELTAELLNFTMTGTKGLHDDLIDALAYLEQIAKTPYRRTGSKSYKHLPREVTDTYQLK